MRFIIILALLFFPLWAVATTPMIKIKMTGLDKEDQQIILSNLSIKNAQTEQGLTEDRIICLHELAQEEITTTLQALGFYQPIIQAKLFSTTTGWVAEYSVTSGPVAIIRSVIFKLQGAGRHNLELIAITKYAPLKIGDPLKHRVYETFKQDWLGKALQLGYLDAVFNINSIHLNTSTHQADIVLEMDTGAPYHFGVINFANPPYPVDYLKQYIPFTPGSPYTTEQIILLRKNLTESDLFSKVKIDPNLNEAQEYAVPLDIQLTPRPRNTYTASTGYGSDTGMRETLGYERRLSSYPGHRFNMNVKGSKRLNQGNVQYSIPTKNPTTDRLVFGFQVTEEKTSDKKYSLLEEIGTTHIQARDQLEQTLALHYRHEKFRLLQDQPKLTTRFLMPSIGHIWSNINRKELLPTGIYASLTIRAGVGLSSTNLMQAQSRVKWALPISDMARVILRTDLGATAVSNMNQFPLSLRFFTGGDHTVRGYGYESLSPKGVDQFGNVVPIGGRYLFVGSAELERRIYKNISAAIFCDTGNAINGWGPRLANSMGFGFRWYTPLGPIRLDIAQALPKGLRKPRVHLTFGLDL